MGLTKRAKILFSVVFVLLLVLIITLVAVFGSRNSKISVETSGIQRMSDIKQSLKRARGKMSQLVNDTMETEADDNRRIKRNAIESLILSVSQLSRSLSDFAEMLNHSGFSNILSRYQKDLLSYKGIIENIEKSNGTIDGEFLAEIKVVEQFFYEEETDLMKVDKITIEQAEVTKDVIDSIDEICEGTDRIISKKNGTISGTTTVTESSTMSLLSSTEAFAGEQLNTSTDKQEESTTAESNVSVEESSSTTEDATEIASVDDSNEADNNITEVFFYNDWFSTYN